MESSLSGTALLCKRRLPGVLSIGRGLVLLALALLLALGGLGAHLLVVLLQRGQVLARLPAVTNPLETPENPFTLLHATVAAGIVGDVWSWTCACMLC